MRHLIILKLLLLFSFALLFSSNIHRSKIEENETEFFGKVTSVNQVDYGTSFEFQTTEKVIVYHKEKINITIGDKLKIDGVLEKPSANKVFNLFNYQNHLKGRKIYWLIKSNQINIIESDPSFVQKLKIIINRRVAKLKTKEYIKSFILGTGDISKEVLENYRHNGIIHILSISGTHIAMIVLVLKKPKYIIPSLIGYLLITGFLISLTRAALFYMIVLIKKKYNINIKNKDILELLALSFLVLNPYLIYSLSFIFSFTITYFIISVKNEESKIKNAINVSIISFLSSIPIILKNFFEINILTPLINIVFIPIFTLIIFPLSIFTFLFPVTDNLLYYIIQITEEISRIISTLSPIIISRPMSGMLIIIYYFFLLKIKKIKTKVIVATIIIIFNNINIISHQRITFIDVDQGDSILIEISNKVVLIDTGGKYGSYSIAKDRIIPYLKSLGHSKIDLLILTHGDADHAKDAIYLLENFNVKQVVLNSGNDNTLEKEIIKKSKKYKRISRANIKLGNYNLEFLNKVHNNENEDSLIIYMEINGKKILLTGDATVKNEQYILDTYQISNIDILKVGHHGSKTSTSKQFVSRLNPEYSVIQVGEKNRFNHPNSEVLDNLKKSKILRTDKNGSIRFTIKENIKIETTK